MDEDQQLRMQVLAECRAERVAAVIARGGTPEEIAEADKPHALDTLSAAWAVAGAAMARQARLRKNA